MTFRGASGLPANSRVHNAVLVIAEATAPRLADTRTWLVAALTTATVVAASTSLGLLGLSFDADASAIFGVRGADAFVALGFAAVGVLITVRQPGNAIGWLFCVIGLAVGITSLAQEYAIYSTVAESAAGGREAAWIRRWLWVVPYGLAGTVLLLLFPDGRLTSPWARWILGLSLGGIVVSGVGLALVPGPLTASPSLANDLTPAGMAALIEPVRAMGDVLLLAAVLGSVASFMLRLRRADLDERLQLKWLAAAALLLVLILTIGFVLPAKPWAWEVLVYAAFLLIPLATGIAILRYRLFDIDVIVNRSLVYVALTVLTGCLYLIAVGAGEMLLPQAGVLPSLLAALVVAAVFAPLRARVQVGVNRMLYGDRDEPYEVLAKLGRRLEETPDLAVSLSTAAESVARALRLPFAAITSRNGAGFDLVASFGAARCEPTVLPLIHQREMVGQLVLEPRSGSAAFSTVDRTLLADLARSIAVAVHAAQLYAELQRSRERLVNAREEERRRLRRDLHDGLGPELASIGLKLETARNRLAGGGEAERLLSELALRTRRAVAVIRQLVHSLRPPALDDLGLAAALRQAAEEYAWNGTSGVAIELETGGGLERLSAAHEVAAYRIAMEAVTNVVRHAGARRCRIRIAIDAEARALGIEVVDDGIGIAHSFDRGFGIDSMRERAAELGGAVTIEPHPGSGTRVHASIPLREIAPA